jgi:hypothetical protein
MALCLNAVSDHLNATVFAGWRESVDGALEAVEAARSLVGHAYLESLVILISANFALGHNRLLLLSQAGQFPISGMNTLAMVATNTRLRGFPL